MTFSLRNDLQLLNHPFYQAWMKGTLTRESLLDYAGQYSHHVTAFPASLESAISKAPNQAAAAILQDQLSEENGQKFGVSHPELWLQFAEGLGLSRAPSEQRTPRAAQINRALSGAKICTEMVASPAGFAFLGRAKTRNSCVKTSAP